MVRASEWQRHIRDTKRERPLTKGKHAGYFGEPGGARTRDHRIKSAMLYQLSYRLSAEENLKMRNIRFTSRKLRLA